MQDRNGSKDPKHSTMYYVTKGLAKYCSMVGTILGTVIAIVYLLAKCSNY